MTGQRPRDALSHNSQTIDIIVSLLDPIDPEDAGLRVYKGMGMEDNSSSVEQPKFSVYPSHTMISASRFVALSAMTSLVAAVAVPRDGNCNTGPISCCNSVMSNTPTTLSSLSGLLGLVLPDITGLIGLSCSPLSILGAGGNSCSAQPVCCTNNQFNGLINLGCSPININL